MSIRNRFNRVINVTITYCLHWQETPVSLLKESIRFVPTHPWPSVG